jgi:hypothetical protein
LKLSYPTELESFEEHHARYQQESGDSEELWGYWRRFERWCEDNPRQRRAVLIEAAGSVGTKVHP